MIQRTDDIEREHRDATGQVAQNLDRIRATHAASLDAIERAAEAEREAQRLRDAGSLRIQWRGLFLIGVGAVLSTWSNLV